MVVWNRFYVKLKINSNFYVFLKKTQSWKYPPQQDISAEFQKWKEYLKKNDVASAS